MIYQYQGNYSYNQPNISSWNNTQKGVYYCGTLDQSGNLIPYYVGQAIGQEGIRGRLLQHLNQDRWIDITHFGYRVCDTEKEANDLESAEIANYQPKYNTQGKSLGYFLS